MTARRLPDPEVDFLVRVDAGGLVLVKPVTDAARSWVDEHVQPGFQTWAGALVVEGRYALDLLEGAGHDGLSVAEEAA